jgi:hypothetical protein
LKPSFLLQDGHRIFNKPAGSDMIELHLKGIRRDSLSFGTSIASNAAFREHPPGG